MRMSLLLMSSSHWAAMVVMVTAMMVVVVTVEWPELAVISCWPTVWQEVNSSLVSLSTSYIK
jgi:hypothetical protein